MIQKICEQCGSAFESNRRKAKFCSIVCYKKGCVGYGTGVVHKKCEQCGESFETRNKKSEFCSRACYGKSRVNCGAWRKPGDEFLTGRGWMVRCPQHELADRYGSVPKSWLVVEASGIKLKKGDKVQFIDGDITNCVIENLRLKDRARRLLKCDECGLLFSRELSQISKNGKRFCSNKCHFVSYSHKKCEVCGEAHYANNLCYKHYLRLHKQKMKEKMSV